MLHLKPAQTIQIPAFDWCHVMFVSTCFASPPVSSSLAHAFTETQEPSTSSRTGLCTSPDSSRDTRGEIIRGTA